jgi:hypothetical protein
MSQRRKEDHEKKLRKICGKTNIDVSDDPLKVEMSKKKEGIEVINFVQ